MIKVFAKKRCKESMATKRYLEKHDIDFEYIRIEASKDALKTIQLLGYNSTPVVVAEDIHWSGYRTELLETLIGGDSIPEADAERVDISIDDEFGDLDDNGLYT